MKLYWYLLVGVTIVFVWQILRTAHGGDQFVPPHQLPGSSMTVPGSIHLKARENLRPRVSRAGRDAHQSIPRGRRACPSAGSQQRVVRYLARRAIGAACTFLIGGARAQGRYIDTAVPSLFTRTIRYTQALHTSHV